MQRLVDGVREFLKTVHTADRELFDRLASGQSPDTMLITCSDSRVVPHLIFQSAPGDLFVLRNAGNIVPRASSEGSAEGAAVEFAVTGLHVRDIVVLGHSHCGAMQGVVDPSGLADLPLVERWLRHASEARRAVRESFADADMETKIAAATEANVLAQLENLQSYPVVAGARAKGRLRLHGWVWQIDTGIVRAFDPPAGEFLPLT